MTADRIEGGAARPPRRGRRWVVVLALAVVVSAALVDRVQAHREDAALVRCVVSAQTQVSHALGVVRAIAQYSSPQLSSSLVTLAVRRSLRSLVQSAAAQGVSPVAQQRALCAATGLLPWHRGERRALKAFVAYLDGEDHALAALARDFNAYGVADAARTRHRQAARAALLDVLSGSRADRVEALLSP
jgi:hypothetical protein